MGVYVSMAKKTRELMGKAVTWAKLVTESYQSTLRECDVNPMVQEFIES